MIGTTIGGHKILAELGKGGMGVVYKAEQIALARPVAMKVLLGNLIENSSFVERFMNEARSIAKLNHPNVVQIFNVGQEGQAYYYTMEFIDGNSLDSILKRLGSLPLDRTISILGWVATALGHIHQHGMVHRDIKPGNILIDKSGRVKLADFGLAIQETEKRLTIEGGIIGTPHYLSPEQAAGQTATALSDIYSLGAVFYELLTGKVPFKADSLLELIRKVQVEEPVPVRSINPEIPEEVEYVILTMMAKDPSHRYQTCEELLADLKRLRVRKRSPAPVRRIRPKRRLLVKVAAAILFIALAGGVGTRLLEGHDLRGEILSADFTSARREMQQTRNEAAANMISILAKSPAALGKNADVASVNVKEQTVIIEGTFNTETPDKALRLLSRFRSHLQESCQETTFEQERIPEGVAFRIESKPLTGFIRYLRNLSNPRSEPYCVAAWEMAEKRKYRGELFSEKKISPLAERWYDKAAELYASASEIARLEDSLAVLEHKLRAAQSEMPGSGFSDTVVLTSGREINCQIVSEDSDSVRIRTGSGSAHIPLTRVRSLMHATPEAKEKLSEVRFITEEIQRKRAELEATVAKLQPFSIKDLVKHIPTRG